MSLAEPAADLLATTHELIEALPHTEGPSTGSPTPVKSRHTQTSARRKKSREEREAEARVKLIKSAEFADVLVGIYTHSAKIYVLADFTSTE